MLVLAPASRCPSSFSSGITNLLDHRGVVLPPGSLILASQQVFLSLGGIEVAHAAERGPSVWSANKEGLISLPGFCALSMLARSLALFLTRQAQAAASTVDQASSGRCATHA